VKINNNCRLFLQDIYYYDLKRAFFNLLISYGFDTTNIPEDKEKRNIAIGIIIKDNPRIGHILRSTVNNIVDKTLKDNNVKENELITRQFDGIIVTKKLNNIIENFSLLIYRIFIISLNRKYYLAISEDNNIFVKGISKKYSNLNKIYQMFSEINYLSKSLIFKKLDNIKETIFSTEDINIFCIPEKTTENIVLKKHGIISIKPEVKDFLDIRDIDRKWYYDHYFKPFIESLFVEFA
jgi:hypothetical protein